MLLFLIKVHFKTRQKLQGAVEQEPSMREALGHPQHHGDNGGEKTSQTLRLGGRHL